MLTQTQQVPGGPRVEGRKRIPRARGKKKKAQQVKKKKVLNYWRNKKTVRTAQSLKNTMIEHQRCGGIDVTGQRDDCRMNPPAWKTGRNRRGSSVHGAPCSIQGNEFPPRKPVDPKPGQENSGGRTDNGRPESARHHGRAGRDCEGGVKGGALVQ